MLMGRGYVAGVQNPAYKSVSPMSDHLSVYFTRNTHIKLWCSTMICGASNHRLRHWLDGHKLLDLERDAAANLAGSGSFGFPPSSNALTEPLRGGGISPCLRSPPLWPYS
jgi:hypothetical protein